MGKGIFRLRSRTHRGRTAEVPGASSKSPRRTDGPKRGAILRRCRRQPLTGEAFWWLQARSVDQGSLSQASLPPIGALLTPATRLRLQDILERIGNDQPVTLQERIDLQKFADHEMSVAGWLRQARWRRQRSGPGEGLDRFLDGLNPGPSEPDAIERPEDEIEGWFGGAPGWVRRG